MLYMRKVHTEENLNEECINAIVTTYFNFIKSDEYIKTNLKGFEISELLRYTICRMFSLETIGNSVELEELSKAVRNILRPVADKYQLWGRSIEYHKGLLEACVHCMEMSRKKAGV